MNVIPQFSAAAQYRSIKAEIDAAIARVLESGQFILGPNVRAFEQELAAFVGVKETVGLNSGTDALVLALQALDIGPGDEVITSPFTFFATSEAILNVGATPVFVDIDPATYNIDPTRVEAAITPRTKAILPVHLYGLMADMPAIVAIARRHDVWVVEDCAQAIGSECGGRPAGSFGHAAAFSFFPTKNLGACGDAGALVTNSDAIAARVRALRAHGSTEKYHHSERGANSRLDELQAAILRVKMRHLDRFTAARRERAQAYSAALGDVEGVVTPVAPIGYFHVFHQYTCRLADRDEIRSRLASEGIQATVYYPVPLHLQAVHARLHLREGAYPNAEAAAREALSLPMYPELVGADLDRVVQAFAAAVARQRSGALNVPA